MQSNPKAPESLQALNDLRDIRGIMERSTRFLSLSGWSGIWAGCTALASAAIAWTMNLSYYIHRDTYVPGSGFNAIAFRLVLLAMLTFIVSFCGAYYFTWRRATAAGQHIWTKSARLLMWQIAIPIAVGGVFCCAFLYYNTIIFIAPACLAFYGLALVNGSKYTLSEIRWLGYSEIMLGCIALFIPFYGLAFMAAGFGALHILYGIIMWNKYDKHLPA